MKQKLAIARALLHDPSVIFLDEPTAALDPEAAFVVREAIEALRRAGRTIVLATHNLDEADRLCDRIAFVRGGLLRVDSPARLRGDHGVRRLIHPAGRPTASIAATSSRGSRPSRGPTRWSPGWRRPAARADDPEAIAPAVGPRPRRGRRGHRRGPRRADVARADLLRRHGRPAGRRRRADLMRRGDRRDDPAPRVDRDRPQPPAALDDPHPADHPDRRPDRARPAWSASGPCRRSSSRQVLSQRPEWAAFTPSELAGAFAVQQFLVFFLLMPAYIPLSIATFSIIGEKQARSLEPVLAAPIRTVELLAGKAVAALVPGLLAGWVDLRRLRGPGLARLRAGPVRRRDRSVVAGRRVPARAGRRPRLGRRRRHRQRPGQRPARRPADRRRRSSSRSSPSSSSRRPARSSSGRPATPCWPLIVLVVSLIGLRIGVRLFDREAILTRWR